MEFEQYLATAFAFWKAENPPTFDPVVINECLEDARENGIDLVLKVPKSVFDKSKSGVPMSKADAESRSWMSDIHEDNYHFNILSRDSKVRTNNRHHLMGVVDHGVPKLILFDRHGGIAVFRQDEIASIELK